MVLRLNITDSKTDVGGVVFDTQEGGHRTALGGLTPINTSASSSSGSLHERTHKRTKSGVQPQIKLVSEKDDMLAVSVFHAQGEEFGPVKEFVRQVMQEFTRVHGKEVASLRSTLDAIADAAANNKPTTSAGMKPEAILFRFEKFEANVEALREKGGL